MLLIVFVLIFSLFVGRVANERSKYLIMSIDSRDLESDIAVASYVSVTAAINRAYCLHHSYDFLVFKVNASDLEMRVKSKYRPVSDPPNANHDSKNLPSAFNIGLRQFRGATWAKVPVLWMVSHQYASQYEYIFMVDSDAAFNPLHINRTLDDAIAKWSSNYTNIAAGNMNISESTFMFLNNYPFREDMPCTGAIIFKPKQAEPMLREWWDYDIPMKNFIHFHEQDALWHMIESAGEYGFMMNNETVSIVTERQFPSQWQSYRDLWLCHIGGYNFMIRKPAFHNFLTMLSLNHKHKFEEAIFTIMAKHLVVVDILSITERMENISSQFPSLRKQKHPPHDLKTQSEWYLQHTTSKGAPTLPAAYLYDESLISKPRGAQIWVVQNKTKRAIPNWDTFQVGRFCSIKTWQIEH